MKYIGTVWALLRFYWRVGLFPPLIWVGWRLQTAYGKWRPHWKVILRDLWQFGGWLREYPRG